MTETGHRSPRWAVVRVTLLVALVASPAAYASTAVPRPPRPPATMPAAPNPQSDTTGITQGPSTSGPTVTLSMPTPAGGGSVQPDIAPVDVCYLSGSAWESEQRANSYRGTLSGCTTAMAAMEIEVCPQIYSTAGTWSVLECDSFAFPGPTTDDSYTVLRTCTPGRLYRAWVWGWVETYDGAQASNSESSNNTACNP